MKKATRYANVETRASLRERKLSILGRVGLSQLLLLFRSFSPLFLALLLAYANAS